MYRSLRSLRLWISFSIFASLSRLIVLFCFFLAEVPIRKFRRAWLPAGLNIFPCPSTDVRGELENVPRTTSAAVKSFRWGAILSRTFLGHEERYVGCGVKPRSNIFQRGPRKSKKNKCGMAECRISHDNDTLKTAALKCRIDESQKSALEGNIIKRRRAVLLSGRFYRAYEAFRHNRLIECLIRR